MKISLYRGLGVLLLAVGLGGTLLPTTPFLIAAAGDRAPRRQRGGRLVRAARGMALSAGDLCGGRAALDLDSAF